MDSSREARITAVAALDEPTRRQLYDYVARAPAPVTRDEAAAANGLARATAAFHLDRLADEGLLEVTFERRTGRSGPGAGRPSKLYCRADRHIEVSLPERQYELAGHLLAAAIHAAEESGISPRAALESHAQDVGADLAAGGSNTVDGVLQILEAHGFEPHEQDDHIVLGNCPFHALARQHTDLVCHMNLHLFEGILSGLGSTPLRAQLSPSPDHCCVRLTRTDPPAP